MEGQRARLLFTLKPNSSVSAFLAAWAQSEISHLGLRSRFVALSARCQYTDLLTFTPRNE